MSAKLDFQRSIAWIVFLVFMVRIVFVSPSLFTPLEASQDERVVPSHYSLILKKRRWDADESVRSSMEKYSMAEFCEEDQGSQENLNKATVAILVPFFHFSFTGIATFAGSDNPFDSIKSTLFPRTYLAFSILRI